MAQSTGFSIAEVVEQRQHASRYVAGSTAITNEIASQIEFVDLLIQAHLGGGSIGSHLALVGAARRLSALLDGKVVSQ